MSIAVLSAQRSKDPNTQVGACIVNSSNKIVGVGYNGFPSGCLDDQLPWNRDGDFLNTKYPYVVHAEQNAIMNSHVKDLSGCTLYVTLFPCNECGKLIIQSGIKRDIDAVGTGLTKVASTHDGNLKHLNDRMAGVEVLMGKIRSDQEKIIESIKLMLVNSETAGKLLSDFYEKQSKAMTNIIQGIQELETHTPIKLLMEQLKDAKQVRNQVLATLSKVVKK